MFITVTLSNPNCPHYGTITIAFPIEAKDYDECLGRLEALELGDPLAQDCKVEAVSDALPLLDCLVGQQVNVDEVDFLARRMEGLWGAETLYLSVREESCPSEILEVIGNDWTVSPDDSVLEELNAMCRTVSVLSSDERNKLGAVIRFAQPQDAIQIMYLAENLDQFEFAADIHTPAEYGRYLLKQSGALGNDETLQGFFDYEGYGKEQIKLYDGAFTERGYVAHHASITLEELMMDDPCAPGVMPAFQMRLDAVSARKSASHKKGARKKGAPHKREAR